jgi:vacuolar-type H+-ATPase subunit H
MTNLSELQKKYEAAEAKAHKLQADRDEAVAKARDRFTDKLRTAVDEAAQAQRDFLDAQVLESLSDRPEAEREAFARRSGSSRPTSPNGSG